MFSKYITDLKECDTILSARSASQKSTCRVFSFRAAWEGECCRSDIGICLHLF